MLSDDNTADLELRLRPCGIPSVAGVPKVLLGVGRVIQPGLARHAVFKPAVCSTDGKIQDEIEFCVKWSVVTTSLAPDVDQPGAVGGGVGESASLPHGLVEVGVGDLQQPTVDVGEEILLRPLKTKGVELGAVSGV